MSYVDVPTSSRHILIRRASGLPMGGGGAIAPVNTVLPAITGTPTVGQTLTSSTGTWDNTPTSYAYQWKRAGVAIGSATASTYLLVGADGGALITVTVTATNAAGSVPATSASVGPIAAVGGAVLLAAETNGMAVDFTYATDANRVAVKTAGVVAASGLDTFFQNTGTTPKQVFDVAGNLIWSPHNMFLNSAAPVTQSVTTVVGQNYTVTVTGSGSMTGSAGASGVATAVAPLTFTATTTTSTFTLSGSLTQIQMNRGAVATAYLLTTATARNGVAIDYDLITHVAKGMLVEHGVQNLLLNSATLSTQSVTVAATPYVLSFWGTGTITLSGVSTAGPLVGTGASNRVSLNFTPTAGSLTCTVTGTVSRAQLETGTGATSWIPTFGVVQTRAADNVTALLSTIPALGAEYSMYGRWSLALSTNSSASIVLTDGTTQEQSKFVHVSAQVRLNIIDAGVANGVVTGLTLTPGTLYSAAARIKLNDCAMSMNGGVAAVDTAVTLPTVTEFRFGNAGTNAVTGAVFNITKMSVVTDRGWSNAELAVQSAVT